MSAAVVNKRKHLLFTLRVLVAFLVIGFGLYYLMYSGQDWSKFWGHIKSVNPLIFMLAVLAFMLSQALVGLRWYILLRLQKIDIGISAAMKLTFVGLFYNNLLPSSVGGDAIRAWYVTKHTPKRLEAVLSVFVDRAIGLACLVLMAIIAWFLAPPQSQIRTINFTYRTKLPQLIAKYDFEMLLALCAIVLLVAILLLYPKTRFRLTRFWRVIKDKSWLILVTALKAVALYCSRPVVMVYAILITLVCQTIFIAGCYFLGKELGITVSFLYYLVFFPISWVLGALPVSIGGAGVMEGGLVYLFIHFAGVDSEAALALAIGQRLIILLGSSPGAFVHILGGHAPKEFCVDYEVNIN